MNDDHHLLPRYRKQAAQVRRQSRKRTSGRRYKLGERRCRLCERHASVRPLTRHHLVPNALGGTWSNDNIVPLCRPCHSAIDATGQANRYDRMAWRSMLRRCLTPGEVSHVTRVMGKAWLDREYPDIRGRADFGLNRSLSLVPRGKIATRAYRRELARLADRQG